MSLRSTVPLSKPLFAVEYVMNTNEKQIALSILESLRSDLIYAHLNNGSRILDVADLRQYMYEMMGRIRTTALGMPELYGNAQPISGSNGHNGNTHS